MSKKAGNASATVYLKPKRIFEIAGSVNTNVAYYVSRDNVTNTMKQDLKTMVDQGRYFSIFAPRQSGKTTFFEGVRDQLHNDPTYIAVILSFEKYSEIDGARFYQLVEEELYPQLLERLEKVKCDKTAVVQDFLSGHHLTDHISFGQLFSELNRIILLKKIVVFIDEFDGIPLSELGNFLNTLRSLYQKYKKVQQKALYSIGLIGIRNITKLIVGGVSPFNIADQVDLPPFSPANVQDLYAQYTAETNQPFTETAVKKIHEETGGQPWLVNRLGTILTLDIKPGTVEPIDETDVDQAIRILLTERNVHFDNLDEKARRHKEAFVEIVFDHVEYNPGDEDQTWLELFGLVKNTAGKAAVSNNIYKNRYIKIFFKEAEAPDETSTVEYELPGDRLDMENILLDFEHYITRIGVRAFYKEKKPYEKTGQFLLTAWLYRFVKGGAGELHYEAVSGLGRMDIILTYKGRKYIVETKVNHGKLSRTLDKGIAQVTRKYLASEAADEGYLVIFDTKTTLGEECEPQLHQEGDKTVTSFIIGIGRPAARASSS